jgi:hypothetical protein
MLHIMHMHTYMRPLEHSVHLIALAAGFLLPELSFLSHVAFNRMLNCRVSAKLV